MLRPIGLIILMAAMPVIAQANTVISIASSSCSGAMSISSLAGASLSCAGHMTLNGGWINSDDSIFIRADGDLLLENLHLQAPEITFSTIQGNLKIASTVHINAVQNDANKGRQVMINPIPAKQIIDWKSFDITLNPGGSVYFGMPSTDNGVVERVTGEGQVVIKADGIKVSSIALNAPASVTSVPEANTGAMLLLGVGLLALKRRGC